MTSPVSDTRQKILLLWSQPYLWLLSELPFLLYLFFRWTTSHLAGVKCLLLVWAWLSNPDQPVTGLFPSLHAIFPTRSMSHHYVTSTLYQLIKKPTSFVRNDDTLTSSVKQWALLCITSVCKIYPPIHVCWETGRLHTDFHVFWQLGSAEEAFAACMHPTEKFHLNLEEKKVPFKWKISTFNRLNKLKNESLSELTLLHWTRQGWRKCKTQIFLTKVCLKSPFVSQNPHLASKLFSVEGIVIAFHFVLIPCCVMVM